MEQHEKRALTIRETAREFGIAEFCIRTLVKQCKFSVIQSGNRVYILREIFDAYLQTGGEAYKPPRPDWKK